MKVLERDNALFMAGEGNQIRNVEPSIHNKSLLSFSNHDILF
jgi:hypothetical protein